MSCKHNHLPHLLQIVQNKCILMITTLVPVFLTHWYMSLLFADLKSFIDITWTVLNINHNETHFMLLTNSIQLCIEVPPQNNVLFDISPHKHRIISNVELIFTALFIILTACLPLYFKFWPHTFAFSRHAKPHYLDQITAFKSCSCMVYLQPCLTKTSC